jgi:hypothetical protein
MDFGQARSLKNAAKKFRRLIMATTAKKKLPKQLKSRNWLAVMAFQRSGAGKHKDKSKYSRKVKHRGRKNVC